MQGNTLFFQVQDTIINQDAIVKPLQSSNLKIERNTIDLNSLRSVNTDTVKKAPLPKPAPVKKTPPLIPLNDSIEHPFYNVLTEKYVLKEEKSFFDHLNVSPFKPISIKDKQKADIKVEPVLKRPENLLEVKENITKENFITTKDTRTVGFGNTDWMLGIIIFSLILFGWLKVGFGRFLNAAIKASYNYFAARRIFEEANVTRSRVFYFMNLLFFVNISLFLTQYLEYNHVEIFKAKGIVLFVLSFIAFVVLYSLKSFVFYALDSIFLSRGGFSSYVFTVFLYNKVIGFLLLPIISILPFVPQNVTPKLFIIGGAIIVLLFFVRVLKGIQLCFKNRLSIFYLFLYLCALEILPALILIKILSDYI